MKCVTYEIQNGKVPDVLEYQSSEMSTGNAPQREYKQNWHGMPSGGPYLDT